MVNLLCWKSNIILFLDKLIIRIEHFNFFVLIRSECNGIKVLVFNLNDIQYNRSS